MRHLASIVSLALGLAACAGYRPAATIGGDLGQDVFVPAFVSHAAYPELDLFASSYLSGRLAEHGCHMTSSVDLADTTIRGTLVSATEEPTALHRNQTILDLVVAVRVDIVTDGGELCSTSLGEGRSRMAAPLSGNSEPERLVALQSATADAIDSLLLEILLCANPSFD
jgi:hypothetical protein